MVKSFAGLFLIIVVVSSLWIPVELPFTIESTALVYPLESWTLQKNPDGTLIGSLHNHRTGQLVDYSSYQFERGDVVHIRYAPELIPESPVDSGMLIATIISNSLSAELIQLENQLMVERARLQSAQVGEKPEIRSEAEEQVRLAEQAIVLTQQRLDRGKELLDEGLIAQAEYEQLLNAHQQAQINIQLAKERYSVVSTGVKPEDIQLIQTRITSLQKQIDFQQNTSALYRVFSPINGRVRFEQSPEGDRLIIDNIDTYVFQVPIKLKDRAFVPMGAPVEWKPLLTDTLYSARLVGWSGKAQVLNREQVVMAQAEMAGPLDDLISGMPVPCTVQAGAVTPIEYFKRSLDIKLR